MVRIPALGELGDPLFGLWPIIELRFVTTPPSVTRKVSFVAEGDVMMTPEWFQREPTPATSTEKPPRMRLRLSLASKPPPFTVIRCQRDVAVMEEANNAEPAPEIWNKLLVPF